MLSRSTISHEEFRPDDVGGEYVVVKMRVDNRGACVDILTYDGVIAISDTESQIESVMGKVINLLIGVGWEIAGGCEWQIVVTPEPRNASFYNTYCSQTLTRRK